MITQEQLNLCHSIADVCRLMNWVPSGDNYRRAKELVKSLDTSHFRNGPWNKGKKVRINNITTPLSELLIENSPCRNTNKVKKRLFKEGLKEEKCEICRYTENLELHHINGDSTDNRLENLQILCPNCHAKTNNFRGKNKRRHEPAESLFLSDAEVAKRYQEKLKNKREKALIQYHKEHPEAGYRKEKVLTLQTCPICGNTFEQTSKRTKYCSRECQREAQMNLGKRPSFLELIKALKEYKNFTQTAVYYNVTDNTVRKWCKIYQIPHHTKEMQDFIKTCNQI